MTSELQLWFNFTEGANGEHVPHYFATREEAVAHEEDCLEEGTTILCALECVNVEVTIGEMSLTVP